MKNKWIKPFDHKFTDMSDGAFVYNGKADYICVPEKINGRTIIKVSGLHGSNGMFSLTPNIKGVMFEKPENILSLSGLFKLNTSEQIDLSELNTSSVLDMSEMFADCKATSLDLSVFDTSKVEDMSGMFEGCTFALLDLRNFNIGNVIVMQNMFRDCDIEVLDLSSFDTTKVSNMNNMFKNSKIQIGYALNQKEAAKFNKLLGNDVFKIKEDNILNHSSLEVIKTEQTGEQNKSNIELVSLKGKSIEYDNEKNVVRRGVFGKTKRPWLYFWLLAIPVSGIFTLIEYRLDEILVFKIPVTGIMLGIYWLIFAPTKVKQANKK